MTFGISLAKFRSSLTVATGCCGCPGLGFLFLFLFLFGRGGGGGELQDGLVVAGVGITFMLFVVAATTASLDDVFFVTCRFCCRRLYYSKLASCLRLFVCLRALFFVLFRFVSFLSVPFHFVSFRFGWLGLVWLGLV